MKKLVLMFVAIAAISFASCGNKTAQATSNDSDSVAQNDSVQGDSLQQGDSTTTATDSVAK